MITSIKEIQNLGKYERYCSSQEIAKQQIIFGFNGSGKSTLSDLFYSLSTGKSISEDRRTLDKVSGEKAGEISIRLGTENEDLVYNQSDNWNQSVEVCTYNEQYIKDYVFVNHEYNQDIASVTIGAESVKLVNEKNSYIKQVNEKLLLINTLISNNKEICGELGLGKNKVKEDSVKRLETIKNLKLFSLSSKEQIKEKMNDSVEMSSEVKNISECIEKIMKVNIRHLYISVADLRKILETVPTVKNSEITEHMQKYLKNENIKWLVSGFYNQREKEYCPYCGQKIETPEAKHFINELEKFVATKMQIKAKNIIEDAKKEVLVFDEETISKEIKEYMNILEVTHSKAILSKTIQKKFEMNQVRNDELKIHLEQITNKLWSKVENPYQTIHLSKEELECISVINKVAKRVESLEKVLQEKYNKIYDKVTQEKQIKQNETLYEVSFGENRENYIEAIRAAEQILELKDKVVEISRKLDDAFDRVQLKKINELLRALNIKFTLEIEGRQYYIKLKDYVPQKYEKDRTRICSEGEKRILAFAYFLSELGEKQYQKIIVIDDPITSLDLSRKSVIAYKISELLVENIDQVILMTHDISFVEQVLEFSGQIKEQISLLELKDRESIFRPLCIKDYLMTDEMIYRSFITMGSCTENECDRIIGLMSLRPYTSIVNPVEYKKIEKESTYFAHTLYAYNQKRNIVYDTNMYSCEGLRKYINDVITATNIEIEEDKFIPNGYKFTGFEYENIKTLFCELNMDTIANARKKAMLLRIALEACLFQLTCKAKFNPERIGDEYKKVIGSCTGEKKKVAKKLKELYDLSKKYHHGADEGSTLGLSWINPDELELFERELKIIFIWIDKNCTIKLMVA